MPQYTIRTLAPEHQALWERIQMRPDCAPAVGRRHDGRQAGGDVCWRFAALVGRPLLAMALSIGR
jgi:hypothetical protein